MWTLITSISCQKGHDFVTERVDWGHIPESQANQWRHKCAACAYEQGYRDAMAEAAESMKNMFTREVQELLPSTEG